MRRLQLTALAAATALFSLACDDAASPLLAPDSPDPSAHAAPGGPPFMAGTIQPGEFHTCALGMDQRAYCWGGNGFGQLGDGTTDPATRAVAVHGGLRFDHLAVGSFHACALTTDGAPFCWGANFYGQLGDGATTHRNQPVAVDTDRRFTSLTAGWHHTCGIDDQGEAFCWGRYALGVPAPTLCGNVGCSLLPVAVGGGHTFTEIDAGLDSTCAIDHQGRAWCWGWNAFRQLGTGSAGDAIAPTPLAGDLTLATLSQGAIHGCALTTAGDAYCWGGMGFAYGQVGTGTLAGSPVPVPVAGGHQFQTISAGAANYIFTATCAVTAGRDAYCWGANFTGQLGTTAAPDTCNHPSFGDFPCAAAPVPVEGGIAFTDARVGRGFSCGTARRGAFCWGLNEVGQHGNGTLESSDVPVPVLGPAGRGRGRGPNAPTDPGTLRVRP
jgi:alpha-tubulin suppressor-like RCC1 family protein